MLIFSLTGNRIRCTPVQRRLSQAALLYTYYTRFWLKSKHFSGFFLLRHHFLDGSAVFLPGQKAHDIFSMRKPRQKVDEKNQQKQKNDVYIRRFHPIAKPKENRLPNSETRNPDQRSHRSPFRSHDVKSDQPKRRKSDEKKPRILAAEIYPK